MSQAPSSSTILENFRRDHAKDINLTLRPAYRDLLQKLGSPHQKLPPVFHVAGTNGKGSTCAFLRAILEAAGYKVHVYTSPHLVRFHERIRIAGKLIEEAELAEILSECARLAQPGGVSYFEAATAAAFVAFARHPADFTILETGLGGRLDATNIVDKKLATIITRLSYDHREYLGDTLAQIAGEKAGIMREGVPCFTIQQPDAESLNTLREAAAKIHAPLSVVGRNDFELPDLALPGQHQYENAALAVAALSVLPKPISHEVITRGLQSAEWPARLQKLEQGSLAVMLPQGWELWLDGGHNDSAGEVLGDQAKAWRDQDSRPLYLVCGMLTTKQPHEFLALLKPYIAGLRTITIPDEVLSFSADELAVQVRNNGIQNATPVATLQQAIAEFARAEKNPARILICGSLYLAGFVLRENGAT